MDNWSLSTNQLTTADIGNDTDCDSICFRSGADADGFPVSKHWRRKCCRLLIARWFNLWAFTTPTCSTEAVITRENSDDGDSDDQVLLWPEYLPQPRFPESEQPKGNKSSRTDTQNRANGQKAMELSKIASGQSGSADHRNDHLRPCLDENHSPLTALNSN